MTRTEALLFSLISGVIFFAMWFLGIDVFSSEKTFSICLTIALVVALGIFEFFFYMYGPPKVERIRKKAYWPCAHESPSLCWRGVSFSIKLYRLPYRESPITSAGGFQSRRLDNENPFDSLTQTSSCLLRVTDKKWRLLRDAHFCICDVIVAFARTYFEQKE